MSLLAQVQTKAPSLRPRIVIYASEKMGKTSLAAYSKKPVFLMTAGETGLLSLIESNQVNETAYLPECKRFSDLQRAVHALTVEDHQFETLVIDTGNGAEQMLYAQVVRENFNGSTIDASDFGKGAAAAVPLWKEFLGQLDRVREERDMTIIFLHHSKVKSNANPTGKDWDQIRPEAIDKLWGLTHKWADVIAYLGTKLTVSKDKKPSLGVSKGSFVVQLPGQSSRATVTGCRTKFPARTTRRRPGKSSPRLSVLRRLSQSPQ